MESTPIKPQDISDLQKKLDEGKLMAIGIKHARLCLDLLEMQVRHATAMYEVSKLQEKENRMPTSDELERFMEPAVQQEVHLATTYTMQHLVEIRAAFKMFVEFHDGKRGMSVRAN